jgi:hypothetical protein
VGTWKLKEPALLTRGSAYKEATGASLDGGFLGDVAIHVADIICLGNHGTAKTGKNPTGRLGFLA